MFYFYPNSLMHLVIHFFVLRKHCSHLVASTWELKLVTTESLRKHLLRLKKFFPHLCYGVLFHIQVVDQKNHWWHRALMPLMSKVLQRFQVGWNAPKATKGWGIVTKEPRGIHETCSTLVSHQRGPHVDHVFLSKFPFQ